MTNDVGIKLNIENYLTNKSNTSSYSPKYKKYKMGGVAGSVMHYVGMGMLAGIFVHSTVSASKASSNVKKDCDEVKELGDSVNDIAKFAAQEIASRKIFSDVLKTMTNSMMAQISDVQKKIDEEEERQKSIYKTTQITNIVVIGSFILLIISKIVAARVNL